MNPATLSPARLGLIGLLSIVLTTVACDPGGSSQSDTCAGVADCLAGDGCCPAGCDTLSDSDCAPVCGNGLIEPGETCEADCPNDCDDGNVCTADRLVGDPQTCVAACEHNPVEACQGGDGCCPAGCDALRDDDCSATCGNGVLEPGETCEGTCPENCNDADSCTQDVLTGSPANCNAECRHEIINWCSDGDGCCPEGCSQLTDADCEPVCGNGVVEAGEACEPDAGDCPVLPEECDDGDACTIDRLSGEAADCTATCDHNPNNYCRHGDGCCPWNCNAITDDDCEPVCGNQITEPGETCDGDCPAGPADCDEGNACTVSQVVGSAAECQATCGVQTPVQACQHGDGCCPDGCDQLTDIDCYPCPAGAHPCVQGCCDWDRRVAEQAQVSFTTGLAVDGDGDFHMVYGVFGYSFHYAILGPFGSFIIPGPPSAGECRHHVLALDGQGRPHVAWYDSGDETLHYALLQDGAWSESVFGVGDHAWEWRPIAMVLNGADKPIIAFRDSSDQSLRLTALGAAWFTTTIDPSTWAGVSVDLDRDSQGDLHVAYTDLTDDVVKYGFNDGGGWQFEQIGHFTGGDSHVSLALGPDGLPRIAFHREDGLVVVGRQGQAWQADLVHPCQDCRLHGLDLEIDSQGIAHLVYSHEESGRLYYARQLDGGYWARLEVASGVDPDTQPDLILDADGLPAIAMDREDPDDVVLLRW